MGMKQRLQAAIGGFLWPRLNRPATGHQGLRQAADFGAHLRLAWVGQRRQAAGAGFWESPSCLRHDCRRQPWQGEPASTGQATDVSSGCGTSGFGSGASGLELGQIELCYSSGLLPSRLAGRGGSSA